MNESALKAGTIAGTTLAIALGSMGASQFVSWRQFRHFKDFDGYASEARSLTRQSLSPLKAQTEALREESFDVDHVIPVKCTASIPAPIALRRVPPRRRTPARPARNRLRRAGPSHPLSARRPASQHIAAARRADRNDSAAQDDAATPKALVDAMQAATDIRFDQIKYAFFSGSPLKFRINFVPDQDPALKQPFEFRFQWDGSWKLTRVILPSALIDSHLSVGAKK